MKKEALTPTAVDKALDLFAEMMIEKIQGISQDWRKPWFAANNLKMPKNFHGRYYNGMNSIVLLMCCEKYGYEIPRFCTFDYVQRLNKESKDMPLVSIKKGEKSFPVMITTFTVVNKETKERIKYEDYKNLTGEEWEQYIVYPKLQVFRVFNVDQTNLAESRPEMYAKFRAEYATEPTAKENDFSFGPVDYMIAGQKWICPIRPTYGDEAYFSISKNEIIVPEKAQFKDGESFYSNLFHEMAHSTGHESQLGRIKPAKFGSAEYAREELVAELTAALVSLNNGIAKHIKDDSAAYLKNWLNSLKEDPAFIKSVLLDVKKASCILDKHIAECKCISENVAAVA